MKLALAAMAATFALPVMFAGDSRIPVIVELFTSEGCSSCPAADNLLARLDRMQPVAGVRVIALEEHVDYWNQLGWVDPFSSSRYRGRQNEYAAALHLDDVYTPQMVVNGLSGFVGNDSDRAIREITAAVPLQTTLVELKTVANTRSSELLDLSVQVTNPKYGKIPHANVYLAVTEDGLSTAVLRGENSGKTLRHAPVVRSFGAIGKIDPHGGAVGQITNTLKLPKEWKRENLRAVVFVQQSADNRITGASSIDLKN